MTPREQLIEDVLGGHTKRILALIIKTYENVEVITTPNVDAKMGYIAHAYDEYLSLKTNAAIRIVGWATY